MDNWEEFFTFPHLQSQALNLLSDSQCPLYISDEALLQPTDMPRPQETWFQPVWPRDCWSPQVTGTCWLMLISGSQPRLYIRTTWEIRKNPDALAPLQAN